MKNYLSKCSYIMYVFMRPVIKLMYRFKSISIKMRARFFFVRLDKLMLRFISKVKGIRKAKSILNNKEK